MKIRIDAKLIIIGDGTSLNNSTVILENDKIIYVDSTSNAPESEKIITTEVLIPGLWDVHAHFTGMKTFDIKEMFIKPTHAILRCVWDAKEALRAGFTSIRDVGGHGIILNKAINEGLIIGPRIYGAGAMLSPTAGHSDLHSLSLDIVDSMKDAGLGELCDGVPECLKAVRKQLRKGAEVIKFCASGGVMSEIDNPLHQQFSMDEMRAIVEEAKRSEVAVAAHCHGEAGIKAALEAGVTTIDHGTYLTEELADLMIEKGAILIPTRYVNEKLVANAKNMNVPDYVISKSTAFGQQHLKAMKIAIDKGVKIATGTDIFSSGPNPMYQWGDNAWELKYLVDMGMTEMEAIVAATGNAPLTLGGRAPKSGMIKIGYDADILTLKENPLENIEVLLDKTNITNVIKQGNIIEF